MGWYGNLRLAAKLMAGFAVVALITGIVAGLGIVNIRRIDAADTRLYEEALVPLRIAGEAEDEFGAVQIALRDAMLTDSEAAKRQAERRVTDAKQHVDSLLLALQAGVVTERERELLDEMARARASYGELRDRVLSLALENRNAEAAAILLGDMQPRYEAVRAGLAAISEEMDREGREIADANTRLANRATASMIVAVLVALAAVVLLGLLLGRQLGGAVQRVGERLKQLREEEISGITRASEAMARGDFSVQLKPVTQKLGVDTRDELGDLARVLDGMIDDSARMVAAFTAAKDAQDALATEVNQLVAHAERGQLAERGEVARHQGAYRALVQRFNDLMNAIGGSIQAVMAALDRAAQRDLTARVAGSFEGEYARVAEMTNTTIGNLDAALAEVATAAEEVRAASGQITDGSQSLASGASEQASSLEEVSSSLQELAATTRQNAASAQEAKSLADGAETAVRTGTESMAKLSEAIAGIKTASDATAKIVKTIDEIAFQTNLLALNAAVEAARAGDAGKGFAVVAEEVRTLAMRSAEAAKNTASLIEEAVGRAESGVTLNEEVQASLGLIRERVSRVETVMAEIAAASEQQSESVTQINAAVEQMNGVTQQVAASSEESASTAEELASQAEMLRGLVNGFALTQAGHARPAARAALPAPRPAPARAAPPRPKPGNGHRRVATELIPFPGDGALAEF